MFEKIKNKPEHERIKYLWISVGVSMFFVSAIWFLSLKSDFDKLRESSHSDLKEITSEGELEFDIKKELQKIEEIQQSAEKSLLEEDQQ